MADLAGRDTPSLPLQGLGVAITRAEPPGGPLERRLARLGARVLRWNAVEIAPPADPRPLAQAVESLAGYDWIVFASAHGVAAFTAVAASVADAAEGEPTAPGEGLAVQPSSVRVAAVGPATAAAAEQDGWRVDRVPAAFSAAGLVESFRSAGDAPGARILLPASAQGRLELAAGLTALGATVTTVAAYRTLPAALDGAACRAALAAGEVDAITFTSPSAVAGLETALGPEGFANALAACLVVSIGPTTTRALADRSRPPDAEGQPSTLDGLAAALVAALDSGAVAVRRGR